MRIGDVEDDTAPQDRTDVENALKDRQNSARRSGLNHELHSKDARKEIQIIP